MDHAIPAFSGCNVNLYLVNEHADDYNKSTAQQQGFTPESRKPIK
jgi:hypothetical protein